MDVEMPALKPTYPHTASLFPVSTPRLSAYSVSRSGWESFVISFFCVLVPQRFLLGSLFASVDLSSYRIPHSEAVSDQQ